MAHSSLYQLIVVVVLVIVDSISQILDMVSLLISYRTRTILNHVDLMAQLAVA